MMRQPAGRVFLTERSSQRGKCGKKLPALETLKLPLTEPVVVNAEGEMAQGGYRIMKATAFSNLASAVVERSLFDENSPDAGALPVPASEAIQRNRFKSGFFGAARTLLFNLFDRSVFNQVSSDHEVSVVFTPMGPIVYRVRE
jgi:hypothetical protein